ncbi:hypothetical protein IKF15_02845 [Candidatus Saccharibacteria bacterium]|nr:hypothetical protein [Candidatus Saccharibacteria bacterium]
MNAASLNACGQVQGITAPPTIDSAPTRIFQKRWGTDYTDTGDRYEIARYGDNLPDCTIILDKARIIEHMVFNANYQPAPTLSEQLKIEFNGDTSVLYGRYREDQRGRFFQPTNKNDAEVIFVRSEWGTDRTRGQDSAYALMHGATYFKRGVSKSGRGIDYWIIPINPAKKGSLIKRFVRRFSRNKDTK